MGSPALGMKPFLEDKTDSPIIINKDELMLKHAKQVENMVCSVEELQPDLPHEQVIVCSPCVDMPHDTLGSHVGPSKLMMEESLCNNDKDGLNAEDYKGGSSKSKFPRKRKVLKYLSSSEEELDGSTKNRDEAEACESDDNPDDPDGDASLSKKVEVVKTKKTRQQRKVKVKMEWFTKEDANGDKFNVYLRPVSGDPYRVFCCADSTTILIQWRGFSAIHVSISDFLFKYIYLISLGSLLNCDPQKRHGRQEQAGEHGCLQRQVHFCQKCP